MPHTASRCPAFCFSNILSCCLSLLSISKLAEASLYISAQNVAAREVG